MLLRLVVRAHPENLGICFKRLAVFFARAFRAIRTSTYGTLRPAIHLDNFAFHFLHPFKIGVKGA